MKITKVKIWAVRQKKGRRRPTFEIRWVTDNEPHSRSRRTKALAEAFRSDLIQATKRGEEFDVTTGLPASMEEAEPRPEPTPIRTVLAVAQAYVAMRWPRAAPKSRDGITDALATVLPALTKDQAGRPAKEQLRTALRQYALLPADKRPEPPPEIADTTQWLESACLPIVDLNEAKVIRPALDALTVNLDGSASAANTISRKRAVFHNFLEYAAELGELNANPLANVKWTPPKTSQTVDPRVVVNQTQARNLLVAVTYIGRRGRGQHLSAMFACMYYAALRPAEAIALKQGDCHLPESGWGSVTLAKSRPEVNIRWSDTGETHGERHLKHRAVEDVRPVPIPPVLVKILRIHIEEYGVAPDGRLFRTERDGPVGSTAYTEVWQEARVLALTPEQVASPLAGRPYDLRHAAVSLWLNGGVSPTEIAKRAGHSVEVLLRVYAKCVHGQEEVANQRIEEILGPSTPEPAPAKPVAKSHRDDLESIARLLRNARASDSRAQRDR
ncbi:MAG TPA: site-specific integrase [Streptosporangiaceae bacterium]|nr:site-specific integrase [Streptosporangiaceae bacterium]